MMMEQLELFELTEIDKLNRKIEGCVHAQDNLRRGIFSRHDGLFKMYGELADRLEEATRRIEQLQTRLDAYNAERFMPMEMPVPGLKRLVFCP